jgi:CheY-like chemotaxis protein
VARPDVLLVEDDPEIRMGIRGLLSDEGLDVTDVGDGREALAYLRSVDELPRLILLDLMMPVMDGWQFRAAQRVDARLSAIPVIVLTAGGEDLRRAKAELGVAEFLVKPVDLVYLVDVVKRLLAKL